MHLGSALSGYVRYREMWGYLLTIKIYIIIILAIYLLISNKRV